jgi:hypothetical protein
MDPKVPAPQKKRIQFLITNLEQKIFIEKQRLEREKK